MKKQFTLKNLLLATAFSFSCTYSFAQAPHWILGGNSLTPPIDAISTTNNFLGSQAGFNVPINFQTNGINRVIFGNGTTAEAQTA